MINVLMDLADSKKSIQVGIVINTLFPEKPEVIRQQMIDYLMAEGIAKYSLEDHLAEYGEYVIEPDQLMTKVMPALAGRYQSIALAMQTPQIASLAMTAPKIETSREDPKEQDNRDRKRALELLIEKNPDSFRRTGNRLLVMITKAEAWKLLNDIAGRRLFWSRETFEKYAGDGEGVIKDMLGLDSITWSQNKATQKQHKRLIR